MSEAGDTVNDLPKIVEGDLDGRGLRVRIVASKYNRAIVDALLEGALKALRAHGVHGKDIMVVRVPGAFEIPLALEQVGGECDAQIALGCVIRGETAHFDQVVGQCSHGLLDAMASLGIPVAFGVLMVENIEQARARAGGVSNRGEEAALAAIETASLLKKIKAGE